MASLNLEISVYHRRGTTRLSIIRTGDQLRGINIYPENQCLGIKVGIINTTIPGLANGTLLNLSLVVPAEPHVEIAPPRIPIQVGQREMIALQREAARQWAK